jgi:hypothetical protein
MIVDANPRPNVKKKDDAKALCYAFLFLLNVICLIASVLWVMVK